MPIKLFSGRVTSASDADALAKEVNDWEERHASNYDITAREHAPAVQLKGDLIVTVMISYDRR
jgi:hypothetical protein